MPTPKKTRSAKPKQRKGRKPSRKTAAAPPNLEETGKANDKDAPVSDGETKRAGRPIARAAVAVLGLGIAVKRLLRKR